ncbi:flavin reductase family protein [Moraxella cuniculi]|uniref:Flavin reductase like domain n=1 Tax=Moraxella cuniculi TaxID=34061 RepID=A0A3S4RLZ2_9GAMM|nr:flavin reductase family protein [Moraxella cuniculi]VEG13805.1 Flavin reductase like domain [Moraxella cuniculi]
MHIPINPKMFYYGFPVVLLTSVDNQGKTNISPISSSWCLGDNVVIGLGVQGKAYQNIQHCPEVVLNIASENLWQNVEKIAPFTGNMQAVNEQYQFCDDKFALAGLTAEPSFKVKPQKITECPLQAEAEVVNIINRDGYAIVELKILQVHAAEGLVFDKDKIDPTLWQPLIYNFRHYQGLGEMLGKNFRAEK